MFGNLMKESGVVEGLSKSAQNELVNICTILLGLSIASTMKGDDFLKTSTLLIMCMGLIAFIFDTIGGVLFLMNTVGGDVSAGLALSEMIASMHKPTVSLVIGDSHSIGVPLAVSTDYSFIVPTATMIVHPVRMNGNIIGARQTYDYFERIQKRIVSFIARKSDTKEKEVENMMMNTEMLTKDLGTILVGEDAVKAGLINEVGGISHAFNKIKELMNKEE